MNMKNKRQLIKAGVSILNEVKNIQASEESSLMNHGALVEMYRDWYSSIQDWLKKNNRVEASYILSTYDSDLLQLPHLYSNGLSFTIGNYEKKMYHEYFKKWEDTVTRKIKKLESIKVENKKSNNQVLVNKNDNVFRIKIKDGRKIWINDFFISNPQVKSKGMQFFTYLRSKPENSEIKREDLPPYLGVELNGVKFTKLLTNINFKGEIRKLFFYEITGDSLKYRGDMVDVKSLESSTVDKEILQNELKLMHSKNKSKKGQIKKGQD